MYFPVAGIEISPFVPLLAAFAVSFIGSMGGISGAVLLLPFQMSVLGHTSPSVSATNQLFNVIALPSGAYRHFKEKRMVWALALVITAGTLPGVFIGALVRVVWLSDAGTFKLFVACVLMYVGARLVQDLLTVGKSLPSCPVSGKAPGNSPEGAKAAFEVEMREFSLRRIAYTFQEELHACPTVGVLALCFVVGIVGGAFGIGGGVVIGPLFVAWFRLPVHTIGGAILLGMFIPAVAGVAVYMLIAPFFPGQSVSPDWALGLLLGLGGFVGVYLGSCCQKRVPASAIKWGLALVLLGLALRYMWEYFV